MKNSFNVTHKNSAKAVAIFFIIVVAIALVAGCGDDNGVNNGNGNPPPPEPSVLVYSLESLQAQTPPNSSISFNDTTSFTNNRIKVTFDLETNCDTSVITFIELIIRNNDSTFFGMSFVPVVNHSYIFYTNVITGPADVKFRLRLTSTLNRFIKVKNFKIYN